MAQGGLGKHRVFSVENVAGSSPPSVRSKVVVLAVKDDLSFFTDPVHKCSSTVRRECWWHEIVVSIEGYPIILIDGVPDLISSETTICECFSGGSRQGRSMKRGKDWPVIARWSERLLKAFERIARLRWEGRFFVGLALAEYDERPGFEVEVTPANSDPPFVVGIAKDLGTADTRVGE